jgi:hypothetical protein
MNRRIARALTRLYSATWQKRYGQEFEALLRDLPLTPSVIVDVVPRAALSRRTFLAAAAAMLVLLTAAVTVQHRAPTVEPVRIVSRDSAPQACRSYSSTTKSGWIAQQRCWD